MYFIQILHIISSRANSAYWDNLDSPRISIDYHLAVRATLLTTSFTRVLTGSTTNADSTCYRSQCTYRFLQSADLGCVNCGLRWRAKLNVRKSYVIQVRFLERLLVAGNLSAISIHFVDGFKEVVYHGSAIMLTLEDLTNAWNQLFLLEIRILMIQIWNSRSNGGFLAGMKLTGI